MGLSDYAKNISKDYFGKSKKEVGDEFEEDVKKELKGRGWTDFLKPEKNAHCDWVAKNPKGELSIIECKANSKEGLSRAQANYLAVEKNEGKKAYIVFRDSSGKIIVQEYGIRI